MSRTLSQKLFYGKSKRDRIESKIMQMMSLESFRAVAMGECYHLWYIYLFKALRHSPKRHSFSYVD